MVLRVFRKFAYSTPEAVARRATNDELFGPSSEELSQLSSLSYKPKACDKILLVIEYRFSQNRRHWRQKLKSLTILQYFVLHGSPQCFEWMTANEKELARLLEFTYVDQHNVDQGRPVRDKAQSLLSYVKNPDRVQKAKEEYRKQRENVRKSIGTGRPSTTSRNTLEMLRDSLFDDQELDTLSPVASPSNMPSAALKIPVSEQRGLCVIEEER